MGVTSPDSPDWGEYARRALDEDRALEDVTTGLLGDAGRGPARGRLHAEGRCVVAGLPLVEAVFRDLDPAVVVDRAVDEGGTVASDGEIASVRGEAHALLSGERVALNYLQHLSGIATVTRRTVEAVAGTGAVITDTRKTTPGVRELEKYAVRVGGGTNHRASLADAVLWKDNHWALVGGAERFAEALRAAPSGVPVCVEVETEAQLEEVLRLGVRWILVDNQPPHTVAAWVDRAGPEVTVEASGGITPDDARAYAEAGARRISMGWLTHAPDPVSISFEVSREP